MVIASPCPSCAGAALAPSARTATTRSATIRPSPAFTTGAHLPSTWRSTTRTSPVALQDEMDFVTAASLGCRFATSFRGVVAQGRVAPRRVGRRPRLRRCWSVRSYDRPLHWVPAVVAVDIDPTVLNLARELGAVATSISETPPTTCRLRFMI